MNRKKLKLSRIFDIYTIDWVMLTYIIGPLQPLNELIKNIKKGNDQQSQYEVTLQWVSNKRSLYA